MKIAICLVACAVSLGAQVTATLSHLQDGMDEVRISNHSAISLVAFVVTAKQASEPIVVYSDPLIESMAAPLAAGEERVVMEIGNEDRRRLLEEPIVTAGILADGTTVGDAALLTRLILRRRNMLLALDIARETLSEAGRRNMPRNQLIEEFRKLADSVSRWYLPPEQQIGRGLYQSIKGKLMNLPDVEVGAAFPPESFVTQEVAELSRRRAALLKAQPSFADAALVGR